MNKNCNTSNILTDTKNGNYTYDLKVQSELTQDSKQIKVRNNGTNFHDPHITVFKIIGRFAL